MRPGLQPQVTYHYWLHIRVWEERRARDLLVSDALEDFIISGVKTLHSLPGCLHLIIVVQCFSPLFDLCLGPAVVIMWTILHSAAFFRLIGNFPSLICLTEQYPAVL
jgi:hypothetical protein